MFSFEDEKLTLIGYGSFIRYYLPNVKCKRKPPIMERIPAMLLALSLFEIDIIIITEGSLQGL